MKDAESPIVFTVEGDELIGIYHAAEGDPDVAVLIVVGGPQYRVGSHRQFVLLARRIAAGGVPVLRFDRRGAGDSSGVAREFEHIGDDIRAAIDQLVACSGVRRIVLWGLCDAASAALLYAHTDDRVCGLVLLNPWVHSAAIEARVRFKTYYAGRLRSAEFWQKLRRFDLDLRDSLTSLWRYARWATRFDRERERRSYPTFIANMHAGWRAFSGPSLIILSGDDLTAAEFRELIGDSREWQALIAAKSVHQVEISEANHTFARADWRAAVENETVAWLRKLSGDKRPR